MVDDEFGSVALYGQWSFNCRRGKFKKDGWEGEPPGEPESNLTGRQSPFASFRLGRSLALPSFSLTKVGSQVQRHKLWAKAHSMVSSGNTFKQRLRGETRWQAFRW